MIEFGSFQGICETAALVICPLVQSSQGVEPTCYSRNVEISKTLLFQPGVFSTAVDGETSCTKEDGVPRTRQGRIWKRWCGGSMSAEGGCMVEHHIPRIVLIIWYS